MGRPSKLLDSLDDATRARLVEAVIAETRGRYVEIYRTFGLADRKINADSFYRWARKTRKDRAKELAEDRTQSSPPSSASSSGLAMATIMRLVDNCNQRLDANDVKALPHLSMMLRACSDLIRLGFDEEANSRATALHDVRLKKLEPEVKKAISEPTTKGAKDLRGILEAVQQNKITIDEATREIGDVIWIEIDKQMRGGA